MFPVAVGLYSGRSQNVVKTLVTHSPAPRVTLSLFLPHFDVICGTATLLNVDLQDSKLREANIKI